MLAFSRVFNQPYAFYTLGYIEQNSPENFYDQKIRILNYKAKILIAYKMVTTCPKSVLNSLLWSLLVLKML